MSWIPLILQGVVVAALLCVGFVILRGGPRSARPWKRLVGLGMAAGVLASGATWASRTPTRVASDSMLLDEVPALGLGKEAGFVTAGTCRSCHPSQYDSWHHSYHRTMTQLASPETVLGNFDGVTLHNRGRDFHLFRKGDEFWVEMVDPDWELEVASSGEYPNLIPNPPRTTRRIVMCTGSHNQQTYWTAGKNGRELLNFPFVWLTADQRWVPREDVFIRPPTGGRGFDRWNNNCIECHAVAGESNLDPHSGRFETAVAELGISCEACHGPGDEHVAYHTSPEHRYRSHLKPGFDPTIVQPERLSARTSAEVCGQCHGMNVFKGEAMRAGIRYRAGDDLTETRMVLRTSDRSIRTEQEKRDWPRLQQHVASQGPNFIPDRFWPDGMVRVSGREHNAMLDSACANGEQLSCLSCHSMHSYHDRADMLKPGMDGDGACLQCHAEFGADIAAHTHHAADSAGSRCMNCHMPHTTYGLLKAIRSHEIDSPSVEVAMATGRPDACSLCHIDKPLGWTADHLARWYGHTRPAMTAEQETISAAILWGLTGDAAQRAIIAWHMGWDEAKQASGDGWIAPYLAVLLDDPYAAVRYIAGRSIRALPGFASLDYDHVAEPGALRDVSLRVLGLWSATMAKENTNRAPSVLIRPDGQLDAPGVARLAAQRNDARLDLRE